MCCARRGGRVVDDTVYTGRSSRLFLHLARLGAMYGTGREEIGRDEIQALAQGTTYIIGSAYDNEGIVIWQKG